jgi:hypothetical protein
LTLRGSRLTDADLDTAMRIALQGLIHNPTAKLLTENETRRIADNIAKLTELVRNALNTPCWDHAFITTISTGGRRG